MNKELVFNRQFPFWLIALSILIGLTLPVLIQDGMFMDAMLYTSVSHNLSQGIGTFWFPQFSLHNVANLPSFHEQPPLVFGIQSLFFKIFGDSMYVERFYTFLTMCITAFLINYLWKDVFSGYQSIKRLGWLPVIFWITIPVCFWSYSNNMHENTMTIFTLISVIIIYKTFKTEKIHVLSCVFAGIFIFLATLSKGFPGFFPITIPFLFWITTKEIRFSKVFIQSLIITLIPMVIYFVLFLLPDSKESLTTYLFKRVFNRISDDPTVDNRFWILYRLFTELIPQISVVLLIILIKKFKKIKLTYTSEYRKSIFFLLIGLSASAPLMLTMVQKGFYFVPSLPYFAIGLAMLIAPYISYLVEKINIRTSAFKIFIVSSLLVFIAVINISFMQIGKASRNSEMLHDVYLMGKIIPEKSVVSIPAEMWNDWGLQCYLVRYYNISLDGNLNNNFCIINNSIPFQLPEEYEKINLKTLNYSLYHKK